MWCACASEVYGSRFFVFVCSACISQAAENYKRWYVERKHKSTIYWFLIGQNVKKWLFLWCAWFAHLGGDPDSCKGYPVYSRLISTLVFHLYHERDGDVQEILLALLSKLSLQRHACYYMKARPDLPTWSLYYIICLHTLKPQSNRCLLCLPTWGPGKTRNEEMEMRYGGNGKREMEKRAFSFITALHALFAFSNLLEQTSATGDSREKVEHMHDQLNTQKKYYRPSRVLLLRD